MSTTMTPDTEVAQMYQPSIDITDHDLGKPVPAELLALARNAIAEMVAKTDASGESCGTSSFVPYLDDLGIEHHLRLDLDEDPPADQLQRALELTALHYGALIRELSEVAERGVVLHRVLRAVKEST